MSKIREAGLLQREIPCIGINTDYSPISMWDKVDIDYIVVAADFLVPLLTQRGVSQEKLLAFGIPVDPKFEKRQGKEEARKKLGLEQIDTILVLSGGAGLGTWKRVCRIWARSRNNARLSWSVGAISG